MGMMRRRPSGESPSSCGGASVTSARSNGSSVKGFQQPEKLAECARRLAFFLLASRVADESTQRLQVGLRMLRYVSGEGSVIGEQLLAQGLEAAMPRGVLRRVADEDVELLADRRRIDIAHQAADILHLPAPRFVALDALCGQHCVAQPIGDLQIMDL